MTVLGKEKGDPRYWRKKGLADSTPSENLGTLNYSPNSIQKLCK